jgi:hypothetical protein
MVKGEIRRPYGARTTNGLNENENRSLERVYTTGGVYHTLAIVYQTSMQYD